MPQDCYDGTIMKGIYKLTGLTLLNNKLKSPLSSSSNIDLPVLPK